MAAHTELLRVHEHALTAVLTAACAWANGRCMQGAQDPRGADDMRGLYARGGRWCVCVLVVRPRRVVVGGR